MAAATSLKQHCRHSAGEEGVRYDVVAVLQRHFLVVYDLRRCRKIIHGPFRTGIISQEGITDDASMMRKSATAEGNH